MVVDQPVRGPFGAPPRVETTTADQIKNLILLGRLRPGDPLPTETELCASLGVSRSSVREAIRTLVALDIVEVRHGHGTFVGQLSLAPLVEGLVFRGVLSPGDNLSSLREVVEVRIGLDLAMSDRIVDALRGTENPDLEALVAAMEEKSRHGGDFFEEDRAFHALLLSHIDNALVGQLVTAFWDVHAAVLPLLGVTPSDRLDDTARAHGLMLRAAQAGDVEAYREAVIAHYGPLRAALEDARAAAHAPTEATVGS
ncbi:MAG TPA: GntR family transcriptional regulator [Cellulomonas sp.]